MILVAGATGFLGGEICRRLIERGEAVRGLVRTTSDPALIDRLRSLGVETVVGDVQDRASLDAACRSVETVVSTVTTTRSRQASDSIEATDEAGQLHVVDAARDAGVRRFVFVSYSKRIDDDGALTHAKRAVEQRVRDSGMSYTILRPTYFMDVWLSPALGFDYINRRATLYGDGENKISFISLGDVAEFAVRSAIATDGAALANATLELGGPEALSPNECVHVFEEVSGAGFDVQHVPESGLDAQIAGATDSLQKAFGLLMLAYAHGDVIPMHETLQRIPVRLTSLRDYARSVVASPALPSMSEAKAAKPATA